MSSLNSNTAPGNASPTVKAVVSQYMEFFRTYEGFGQNVCSKLLLEEVSVDPKKEEPRKREAKVVIGLTVDNTMINGLGHIHGGCTAFLIDICSTVALAAYAVDTTGATPLDVTQVLNIVYHSPAFLNDHLLIRNTTLTYGSRCLSARTEVWNTTKGRLVASGVHLKMFLSASDDTPPLVIADISNAKSKL